jgi:pyridoxal 5'-phosphate synthase pdxT subunit
MRIGVLALQGDFIEHQAALEGLGAEVVQVRLPEHLEGLNGLVMPGGESTTIGKLAVAYQLMEPLRDFGKKHAIWGTCAGAIFLARDIHRDQPLLGLMDIEIERNAFGRQVDSFEMDLTISCLQESERPYHAVFIRAPLIEKVGQGVSVLSALPDGRIVAARQGHWLATSFHPELTPDTRFHRYFMEMSV